LAIIIAMATVHGAVVLAKSKISIIAVDDLRDRTDTMCSALIAKDARALYDLRTPEFRGCTQYEAWLDDFTRSGEGRVVACKPIRVKPAERKDVEGLKSQCSTDAIAVESAAVVTLRIKLVRPNGESEVIDEMLNGWVRIGGIWYWYDWTSPSMD